MKKYLLIITLFIICSAVSCFKSTSKSKHNDLYQKITLHFGRSLTQYLSKKGIKDGHLLIIDKAKNKSKIDLDTLKISRMLVKFLQKQGYQAIQYDDLDNLKTKIKARPLFYFGKLKLTSKNPKNNHKFCALSYYLKKMGRFGPLTAERYAFVLQ